MWQIGKTYTFVPSGDSSELLIKIVGTVDFVEARDWYERTYNRPFDIDSPRAYKAIIVRGGYDGDVRHSKDDVYYVFDADFGPTHSQPEGPRVLK